MSNTIIDLFKSTTQLLKDTAHQLNQAIHWKADALKTHLQLTRELREIKDCLRLADEELAEPLDTDGLHEEIPSPELPVIEELQFLTVVLEEPHVLVLPDISLFDGSPPIPSDIPSLVRRDLPVLRIVTTPLKPVLSIDLPPLPELELPEPSSITSISLPQVPLPDIDSLPDESIADIRIPQVDDYIHLQPQSPIDDLPVPFNDPSYWENQGLVLDLPFNKTATRVIDWAQMQLVYDHVGMELINAIIKGRGELSGAMTRSMLTTQRQLILGDDAEPDFNGLDVVISTAINNIYIDISNQSINYPPSPIHVSERFWSWFTDIGHSEFLEYLALTIDDLPEEDFS